MGGLSGMHILLIVVIILVFFGPSRLPGLGKSVGEAIRGFKKGIEGDEIDVTANNNTRRENLSAPQQDGVTQTQAQREKKSTDA